MLPFETSLRKFMLARLGPLPEDFETESEAREPEPEPTAAEAHIAWLAGAPYVRLTDSNGEETRFVSLLVPFY